MSAAVSHENDSVEALMAAHAIVAEAAMYGPGVDDGPETWSMVADCAAMLLPVALVQCKESPELVPVVKWLARVHDASRRKAAVQ